MALAHEYHIVAVNLRRNEEDREIRMDRPIVVVDADKVQCKKLCTLLERSNYRTVASHSLTNLEKGVQKGALQVVILDLDNLPVDNRFVVDLRRENPGVRIMGLSSRPFHPELQEAISKHFYACLYKPVDTDELFFWLRSIWENGPNYRRNSGD